MRSHKIRITLGHVDDSVQQSGNGLSWGSPFKTLQEALDAHANESGQNLIKVAQGIYFPTVRTISSDVRSVTFMMAHNLEIRGGYQGGGQNPDLRDPEAFETILSGVIPAPDPVPPGHEDCPGAGDCFTTNGSPGCANEFCCSAVCTSGGGGLAQLCCEFGWVQDCVDKAFELLPD